MIDTHKSANPAATGFDATNQNTPCESTPQTKRLATVTAQLTLAGHAVHHLERGYLVTRWGMTRVCPDLGALVAFARQVGGRNDPA